MDRYDDHIAAFKRLIDALRIAKAYASEAAWEDYDRLIDRAEAEHAYYVKAARALRRRRPAHR